MNIKEELLRLSIKAGIGLENRNSIQKGLSKLSKNKCIDKDVRKKIKIFRDLFQEKYIPQSKKNRKAVYELALANYNLPMCFIISYDCYYSSEFDLSDVFSDISVLSDIYSEEYMSICAINAGNIRFSENKGLSKNLQNNMLSTFMDISKPYPKSRLSTGLSLFSYSDILKIENLVAKHRRTGERYMVKSSHNKNHEVNIYKSRDNHFGINTVVDGRAVFIREYPYVRFDRFITDIIRDLNYRKFVIDHRCRLLSKDLIQLSELI